MLSLPDRAKSIRNLVEEARADNARVVAAAIGGHLSAITGGPRLPAEVDEVSKTLRDASFDLLTALYRGGDPQGPRADALRSIAALETALRPAPVTNEGPAPMPMPKRRLGLALLAGRRAARAAG